MKFKMRLILAYLCLTVLFLCKPALAAWPVFSYPSYSFLKQNGYVTEQGCPPGQGKIIPDSKIPMVLVRGTQPQGKWKWTYHGNSECMDLNTEKFIFSNYKFQYYKTSEGDTLYTRIDAFAKQPGLLSADFKFRLETPHNYWYCHESYAPENLITCANDI